MGADQGKRPHRPYKQVWGPFGQTNLGPRYGECSLEGWSRACILSLRGVRVGWSFEVCGRPKAGDPLAQVHWFGV